MKITSQKITPFLWFDGRAEEAARFYVSVFKRGKILSVSPVTVAFELEGQRFVALNGGPHYRFTPAVSFFVRCQTQREVDYYWKKLAAGGAESHCGWLKDKFGLSWQIVPEILGDLLGDSDEAKSGRALRAMLKMNKLDIKALKRAHAGK